MGFLSLASFQKALQKLWRVLIILKDIHEISFLNHFYPWKQVLTVGNSTETSSCPTHLSACLIEHLGQQRQDAQRCITQDYVPVYGALACYCKIVLTLMAF